MMNPETINGQRINQASLDASFLTGPGEDIVPKTLLQLSAIPQFVTLFGPYKSDASGNKKSDQQRWADYQRMDWSIRQLPVINVFEAESLNRDSDQAFLRGTVQIQAYWPANMRRGDLARVPATFSAILENFFSSHYCTDMLDPHFTIQRPMKVFGLNEYGKMLTWSPNVEGLVENELVPVTILNVQYRIDLRAWYRQLHFTTRTRQNPFVADQFGPLTEIDISYNGIDPDPEVTNNPQIVIEDTITYGG